MASSDSGTEYSAEADAIARRRRLAEALSQQGMQGAPAGQMAGRYFVPTSPLLHMAKALQGYAGMKMGKEADTQAVDLGKKRDERRGADMALLAQALSGRQGSSGGLTEDAAGNVTQADPVAALSPVQSLQQAIPMMGDPQMQRSGLQATMGAQQRQEQHQARLQERILQIDAQMAMAQGNREFQEKLANMRADLAKELAEMRSQMNQDRSPYFQFLQTPTGFMAGNARTGQVTPVTHNGQQVMPAQIDPSTQRGVAEAKAGGKEIGEATAQAQVDLPRVINNANNSLQLIDQMVGSEDGKKKEHPGFQSAVGLRIPGLGLIPGTETSNFNALLDQVKGGAFLEAFNSLKGGGQITEVEGKKATDAITRMSNAQSEAEFRKAAREYQEVIRLGVKRAQQKAGQRLDGPDRRGVPAGVDPAIWNVMTPEEKALWAR